MMIVFSLPVPLSFAVTWTMPLASMSKVTSICGTPRGAGAMPASSKEPSSLFCAAISRSPWKTWICTDGWLSSAVVKVSDRLVGMVVLRSMSLVMTPPLVSMPSDSGVTSSRSTSLTSPRSTPAWRAAPTATTSSGLTPLLGSLPPVSSLTRSDTAGIRVEPPTSTTWSICETEMPASLMTAWNGWRQRSSRSCVMRWNSARERVSSRNSGFLSASTVMYGRLIEVDWLEDSSILAFSAASRRRWSAILSLVRSMPFCALNLSTSQSTIRWSQSSPPRWLSPEVARTSTTPSPMSSRETSKVPPPRSKTRMVCSLSPLSRP